MRMTLDGAAAVERELLAAPLGFKGAYLTELWQTVVRLRAGGAEGIGLGVQSVLWSDERVFAAFSELHGNTLMHQLTRHALQLAGGLTFRTPPELLDELFAPVYAYGRKVAGEALKPTFALSALAAIDHAAWMLHAAAIGARTFDALLPGEAKPALQGRQRALACMPLISYGMSEDAIAALLRQGYYTYKIKLGHDPDQDGDRDKMLAWDMRRLAAVHRLATASEGNGELGGRIAYYLDANGRYDSRDRLLRLFEYADRIGALGHIVLFEEPFPAERFDSVAGLPVRMAADESVASVRSLLDRIDLGYTAVALMPTAKTMSVSLRIAAAAYARGVDAYCSDMTANPLLADWCKNLAARLQPLSGSAEGAMESNGAQHYLHWERMRAYHPRGDAPWTATGSGRFVLDEAFYETGGGIFDRAAHYEEVVNGGRK
ncbi:MAG: mandelate racemase/muconate lactonizing enzyme family protein [Paenibacillaceae bacterium]|nr:mandelate racemase/muconate lactonizing enzyme family protein [Paenibacillaceae bacterium]